MDDHPDWCSPRRCTASSLPFQGHATATHRSAPEASGPTEIYLVQTPGAPAPLLELVRAGQAFRLPLLEAQGLPPPIADLLFRAGVTAVQPEPDP